MAPTGRGPLAATPRRHVVGLRRVLDRRGARDRLAWAGSIAAPVRGLCSRCGSDWRFARPEAQRGVRIMTMLKELAAELIGMFVGEKRVTISVLAMVAAAGSLVDLIGLGGAALLFGCLILLIESVCRSARQAPLR